MGNQRFSITPATAATDLDMPDSIFRTLAVIGIYGDQNGWCWPSQSTIAQLRGVSRRTVIQHVKTLVDMGYINVQPRYDKETGAQRSNMMQIKFDYNFTPPVKSKTSHPLGNDRLHTPHEDSTSHITPQITPYKNEEEPPSLLKTNATLASGILQGLEINCKTSQWTHADAALLLELAGSHDKERFAKHAKSAYAEWCASTTGKGKRYNPNSAGWLDWLQERLSQPVFSVSESGGIDF